MSEEEKTYEVWLEGYSITGNSSTATFLGSAVAASFREATIAACKTNAIDYDERDDGTLHFWGMRFFDNETDARKSFG